MDCAWLESRLRVRKRASGGVDKNAYTTGAPRRPSWSTYEGTHVSTNEPSPSGFEPEGPGREALDTLYRFVAALELTPTVAVHSIDQDGLVRFWNHSCEDIFGISAREAIGQPLTSLVDHLERETEFAKTVATIWKTHRKPLPHECHVRCLEGKTL